MTSLVMLICSVCIFLDFITYIIKTQKQFKSWSCIVCGELFVVFGAGVKLRISCILGKNFTTEAPQHPGTHNLTLR